MASQPFISPLVHFIDVMLANRHLVLRAGESEFTVASRALARRLLYKHLQSLNSVNTHTFKSLSDKKWVDYHVQAKVGVPSDRKIYSYPLQPMFIMINDGGTPEEGVGGPLTTYRILVQRLFIFDLLASGIPLAPLQGAVFKDLKVISCLPSFSAFRPEPILL